MQVEIRLTGWQEISKKLTDEAPKVAKKYLRRASKKAAEIWEEAISERAPELTGFLASHIVMQSTSNDAQGTVSVAVGGTPQAFYGSFREFGTRFQSADPFMRPAFEETKDQVLQTFEDELKDDLGDLRA